MLRRITALAAAILVGSLAAPAVAQAPGAKAPAYFLCRLLPPRATFPADMSPAEAAVMARHVAYWNAEAKDGHIVVFGPVMDPKGAWGVMVLRAADRSDVVAETDNDPAIKGAIGMRYEIFAMPRAVVPGAAAP